MAWNPWRALRAREHIRLDWLWLNAGMRGYIEDDPPGRRIVLARGLSQPERRAALAHELVHDERGLLPQWAPVSIRAKDERAVDAEVARRLVPADELAEFVLERLSIDEPVTAACIAERFGVPLSVATEAARQAR